MHDLIFYQNETVYYIIFANYNSMKKLLFYPYLLYLHLFMENNLEKNYFLVVIVVATFVK